MVKLIKQGVYFMEGHLVKEAQAFMTSDKREKAIKNTVTYSVLAPHVVSGGESLTLKTDGVLLSASDGVRIAGYAIEAEIPKFSLPCLFFAGAEEETYSARADENLFCLTAAKRFGADYVPSHFSEPNEYLRDRFCESGKIYLASERTYNGGTVGAMTVSAQDSALVQVLSGAQYELPAVETVAVYLRGKLGKGVGAFDVALELLEAVQKTEFIKGKILEFFGSGLANLSMDARAVIDSFAREAGCVSTVWETDAKTEEFYKERGRTKAFKKLAPKQPAYYDWGITVDLSRVEPMAAYPAAGVILPLSEFTKQLPQLVSEEDDITLWWLKEDKIIAERAVLAGETHENIAEVAEILREATVGGFGLTVSPASQSAVCSLAENGYLAALSACGAALQAPCQSVEAVSHSGILLCTSFAQGAGGLTVLMDARSVAATAKNGGIMTSALDLEYNRRLKKYKFNEKLYKDRVYCGKKADGNAELIYAPLITPVKKGEKPAKNQLLKIALCTKETFNPEDIIGDNLHMLSSCSEQFAGFVLLNCSDEHASDRGEAIRAEMANKSFSDSVLKDIGEFAPAKGTRYGGAIVALNADFGEKSEYVASSLYAFGCRVFITKEQPDESVKSALIAAGIVPLTTDKIEWKAGETLYFADITGAISRGDERVLAKVLNRGKSRDCVVKLPSLTENERKTLLAGGWLCAMGNE